MIAIISEELFLEHSPIKENTVLTKFVPYVKIAQRLYIKPILGDPLLNELQEQVKANDLTPHNKALILEIAPALSFYSVYQGLPMHWATIQNKGITKLSSENSEALEINDLGQIRRWTLETAEVFADQLRDYLKRCAEHYPTYRPERSACDDNRGADNTLDFGIFIPKR